MGPPTHGPASACSEMSIAALVLAKHERTGLVRAMRGEGGLALSRGGESAISAQGSAQATAQTHPALPEPPLGAPAVPSGLNAASGAGGASV